MAIFSLSVRNESVLQNLIIVFNFNRYRAKWNIPRRRAGVGLADPDSRGAKLKSENNISVSIFLPGNGSGIVSLFIINILFLC